MDLSYHNSNMKDQIKPLTLDSNWIIFYLSTQKDQSFKGLLFFLSVVMNVDDILDTADQSRDWRGD